MRLLFIASDAMEFRGALRRSRHISRTSLPVDWSREVSLNGSDALLVANGVGAVRAAAAARQTIDWFQPEAVISTGFCGALCHSLKIADVVVADRVVGGSALYPARTVDGAASATATAVGSIRSISYVAQTAAQKRELASGGAIAVEMEAAGVASEAARRSLPFYCVRAVTDLAGEDMANDFNNALRPDGHFATMKILREAFLDPANRLPELLRLNKRCILAAWALGDFFANNRF